MHIHDLATEDMQGRLADGELSVSVDEASFAGNARLANAFNGAATNLRDIISETRTSASSIQTGSSKIA